MIRLAAVIDAFETDFLTQYRHKLSFDPLRALSAITHCRMQSSLKRSNAPGASIRHWCRSPAVTATARTVRTMRVSIGWSVS